MKICQIWNGANSRSFLDNGIKFPELSTTYTFQNFPGPWKGENPELSRTFQEAWEPRKRAVSPHSAHVTQDTRQHWTFW